MAKRRNSKNGARVSKKGSKGRPPKKKEAPKGEGELQEDGKRKVVLDKGAFDAAELHASRDKIMELRGLVLQKNGLILQLQQQIVEKDTQLLEVEKQATGKQNETLRERFGLRLDATLHKDDDTHEVFYILDAPEDDEGKDDEGKDDEGDGDEPKAQPESTDDGDDGETPESESESEAEEELAVAEAG